jgi:hypothetical protein
MQQPGLSCGVPKSNGGEYDYCCYDRSSGSSSGSSSGGVEQNGGYPTSVPGGTAYTGRAVACLVGDAWAIPAGDAPPDSDPSSGLACSIDPVTDPVTGDDIYCCFDWTGTASTCAVDPGLTADCQAVCAVDVTNPCTPGNVFGFQCAPGDDPTSLYASLDCSAAPTRIGSFCCQ